MASTWHALCASCAWLRRRVALWARIPHARRPLAAAQDTFGAEFKALRAPDITEDGDAAATEQQQPEPLERKTEHGFWTATPIWSTDSAASGAAAVTVRLGCFQEITEVLMESRADAKQAECAQISRHVPMSAA